MLLLTQNQHFILFFRYYKHRKQGSQETKKLLFKVTKSPNKQKLTVQTIGTKQETI